MVYYQHALQDFFASIQLALVVPRYSHPLFQPSARLFRCLRKSLPDEETSPANKLRVGGDKQKGLETLPKGESDFLVILKIYASHVASGRVVKCLGEGLSRTLMNEANEVMLAVRNLRKLFPPMKNNKRWCLRFGS